MDLLNFTAHEIHDMKKSHALKTLQAAVRDFQGTTRASYAAKARPVWWLENSAVTFPDGNTLKSGPFVSNHKTMWKIDQIRACLLMYINWTSTATTTPTPQSETPPAKPPKMKRLKKKCSVTVLDESIESSPPVQDSKPPLKHQSNIHKSPSPAAHPQPVRDTAQKESPTIVQVDKPASSSSVLQPEQSPRVQRLSARAKKKRAAVINKLIAKVRKIRDNERKELSKLHTETMNKWYSNLKSSASKLQTDYQSYVLQFPKNILDMPIRTFTEEFGGSLDAVLTKDFELAMDKFLNSLRQPKHVPREHNSQPKTPSARARRQALTNTISNTIKKDLQNRNQSAIVSSLRSRPQRSAAKTAMRRNRELIAKTPAQIAFQKREIRGTIRKAREARAIVGETPCRLPVAGEVTFSMNGSPVEVSNVNSKSGEDAKATDSINVARLLDAYKNMSYEAMQEFKKQFHSIDAEQKSNAS